MERRNLMELQIYDEVEFYFIFCAVVVLLKNNFIFLPGFFTSVSEISRRNVFREKNILWILFLYLWQDWGDFEASCKNLNPWDEYERKKFPQRQIISESRPSHRRIYFIISIFKQKFFP